MRLYYDGIIHGNLSVGQLWGAEPKIAKQKFVKISSEWAESCLYEGMQPKINSFMTWVDSNQFQRLKEVNEGYFLMCT